MLLRRYDVFISYARADVQRVRPLVEELRRLGYRVFFDMESIRIGERWKPRLESSIRRSGVLVLCWSVEAKNSEFVQFEYSKADGLDRPVLPWRLDHTPLPVMLEIQALTGSEPQAVAAALAARIGWNVTRRSWIAAAGAVATTAVAVAVWKRPRGYEFEGIVTDVDSQPLSTVIVTAENTSGQTDAQGKFRLHLSGDKPEWIRLRFNKPGYVPEWRNAGTEEPFRMVLVRLRN